MPAVSVYFNNNHMETIISRAQSERHLIVLRPVQNSVDNFRLGLFTAEYREYVRSKEIKSLHVNLDGTDCEIDGITTYLGHGSIVDTHIINDWLHSKGFGLGALLLFELVIDKNAGIHIYRFLGSAGEIRTQATG